MDEREPEDRAPGTREGSDRNPDVRSPANVWAAHDRERAAGPARAGAHAVVGDYGLERIPDPSGSIQQFQRIRLLRKCSEYEDFAFGRQDVDADLTYATDIVAAVRADLT